MALGGEIVKFIRLDRLHQADKIAPVSQVAGMQMEIGMIERPVIEALPVVGRGVAPQPVNLISLREKETGQQCAILACHPGYQSNLAVHGDFPLRS